MSVSLCHPLPSDGPPTDLHDYDTIEMDDAVNPGDRVLASMPERRRDGGVTLNTHNHTNSREVVNPQETISCESLVVYTLMLSAQKLFFAISSSCEY